MRDQGEGLRLHQINIEIPGFLVTDPILCTAEEIATPSQSAIKEEEEIVDISESDDDFEVFSHHKFPKVNHTILKSQSSSLGLSKPYSEISSHSRRNGVTAQVKDEPLGTNGILGWR